MERDQIRDRMASAACMPKDVVLGSAVITLTGQTEACIENYRGMIEYTDSLVRLKIKGGQIRLVGKGLSVEYYTNDEMKITGIIQGLEFCAGRSEE